MIAFAVSILRSQTPSIRISSAGCSTAHVRDSKPQTTCRHYKLEQNIKTTMATETEEKRTVNTAPVKWAQRSDCLYLTVDLHGVSDDSISFTETEMHFRGMSEGKYFEANLEFFKPINPEKCKWKNHPLGVEIYVPKKKEEGDEEEKFWQHLLKNKSLEKLNTVTTDWNHYIDSDEEDTKETGFDWAGML